MNATSSPLCFPIKFNPRPSYWAWWIAAGLGVVGLIIAFLDSTAWAAVPWVLFGVILCTHIGYALRKVRCEILPEGLRLRGDLSTELVRSRDLDTQAARIINFKADPGMLPKWKLLGTGLPGYCSGWFRLRNGKKALVFLSELTEAVCIPTRKGNVVLFSAENNTALLLAIQEQFGTN